MGVHVHVFAHLVRNTVKRERDAERAAGVRADAADEHAARGAAAVRRGRRPGSRPAVHGRGLRPAHASGSRRRAARRELGPLDAALRRGGRARRRCTRSSRSAATRTSCRSSCRPRSASSGCWRGRATRRDEMVGKLRPTIGMEHWHFDVEKVAVNAVMAGAAPGALPGRSSRSRSSGDTGRQSSMSSMGNMVVVNGPIRHEIGMNSGIGAMGPYNYANSAIGRAFGLALAEPPGRLGARASPTPARRAATSPTTASPSPRTRRRAPGSRTTCSYGYSTGTRAPSPSPTSGAASGPSTCARTGRRSSRR